MVHRPEMAEQRRNCRKSEICRVVISISWEEDELCQEVTKILGKGEGYCVAKIEATSQTCDLD